MISEKMILQEFIEESKCDVSKFKDRITDVVYEIFTKRKNEFDAAFKTGGQNKYMQLFYSVKDEYMKETGITDKDKLFNEFEQEIRLLRGLIWDTMSKVDKLNSIYDMMPPDYKGKLRDGNGTKTILINRNGVATSVLLDSLTDKEIARYESKFIG